MCPLQLLHVWSTSLACTSEQRLSSALCSVSLGLSCYPRLCSSVAYFVPLQERLKTLQGQWEGLLQQAELKRKRLTDAQRREVFVHEADEVLAWISDKKAVAGSEELGRDLEHVLMLQKKFNDFLKVGD